MVNKAEAANVERRQGSGASMSAYRVALCEDEAVERDQIAGLCRDIFSALGVEAEVVPFPSADDLRRTVEAGRTSFDLYLLDIQMREGASGLDLARQLYHWGVQDKIIFLTGSLEYAIQGYDVEPLHYLLKPVSRERMEEGLQRALRKRGPRTVRFQRSGKVVSLPVPEIRYLESRDHGTVVYLRDGVQTFSISLAEAEQLLPRGIFRRCHKSYLVNLNWVSHASHSGVYLKDDSQIPMGRAFYTEIQNIIVHRLND